MTVTLLTPIDGSGGRDKTDARAVIDRVRQIPADEWNNIKNGVMELQAHALGDARRIRVSPAITADQAVSASYDIHQVNNDAGEINLTLPAPSPAGQIVEVKKVNVAANKINMRPHNGATSVEGATAGDDFTLPSSNAATRGYWRVYSDGTHWWLG
jgi:hypothetical protein